MKKSKGFANAISLYLTTIRKENTVGDGLVLFTCIF